jgi:hypothetical protein
MSVKDWRNKSGSLKKVMLVFLFITLLLTVFLVGLVVGSSGDVSLGGLTNTFEGNVVITGNLYAGNIKSGSVINCSNGTWIAHELPGDPATEGSITLALRGPSQYNETRILCVPTVLSSNSTHFQIEFLCWETGTWTLIPVSVSMGQTVWWDAKYNP